jgi:uncharacterized membrane protein
MYAPANQYVPQTTSIRRPLVMWLLVASGSLLVVAVIVGAPLTLATGHSDFAATIYQTFSHLCHQLPERSFFIAGHPFAVCARCTGIYAGFAAAVTLYPLARSLRCIETPARKWLFIAAAPLAIDFAIEFSGIWHNTHYSRLVTGAILGAVAVFYIMPGLLDLSLRSWKRGGEDTANIPTSYAPGNPPAKLLTRPASAPSDYSAPHRRI